MVWRHLVSWLPHCILEAGDPARVEEVLTDPLFVEVTNPHQPGHLMCDSTDTFPPGTMGQEKCRLGMYTGLLHDYAQAYHRVGLGVDRGSPMQVWAHFLRRERRHLARSPFPLVQRGINSPEGTVIQEACQSLLRAMGRRAQIWQAGAYRDRCELTWLNRPRNNDPTVAVIPHHAGPITGLRFTKDGRHLWGTTIDGQARMVHRAS